MSANAYLYRRSGTYYFRWTIPLACRARMPSPSPAELRISLRTTHPATARHRAARCWLAALETAEGFLVSARAIRYKDLVLEIRERAQMPTDPAEQKPSLVSLGVIAGTVELQAVKDTMAHLDQLGAHFYVPIDHCGAALWRRRPDLDGSLRDELVERVEDFGDPSAQLPRASVIAALAANQNLLTLETVQSRLPGMWEGSDAAKRPFEVRLDAPLLVNLSAVLVDAALAKAVPRVAPRKDSPTGEGVTGGCDPILLSKGLEEWLMDNAGWSDATRSNYQSYVQQFIAIVGDLQTTDLTADHFRDYDKISRALPKNWRSIHTKSGKTLRKIAEEPTTKGSQTSPKTLKEKGATLRQFFAFLEGQGYWHGRYGKKLFEGVKAKKGSKKHRRVFTNAELQDLFTGSGFPVFEQAKFALYVWGSILLLYTGARPAEISQLRHEDVVKDQDGTWYLRISASEEDEDVIDDGDGKRLKTDASSRSVPLHPQVISLGFLSHVDQFKAGEPLFPEATRHAQKVSRELGDWANQKLLPATALKDDGAVLYSLRHTVIERFKCDATADYLACAYVGHGTDEDTRSPNKVFVETYGRAHSPATLAAKLHPLLDYGIDWTPFKPLIAGKVAQWGAERKKIARAKKSAKTATRK